MQLRSRTSKTDDNGQGVTKDTKGTPGSPSRAYSQRDYRQALADCDGCIAVPEKTMTTLTVPDIQRSHQRSALGTPPYSPVETEGSTS